MQSKRFFDLICSFCGLVLLSPIFLVVIVLIKLTSKGPIFFRQIRVGQYEVPFRIHKFRTMVVDAESKGLKITVGKDSRITAVGHFLRKTKLDELPQLIDVLIGNMSLVGPRPEVPEYVLYYTPEVKAKIFKLKPGITDEASILMIDENEILQKSHNPQQTYISEILPQKLAYAANYADNRSFVGDIGLIFKTIHKIFTR